MLLLHVHFVAYEQNTAKLFYIYLVLYFYILFVSLFCLLPCALPSSVFLTLPAALPFLSISLFSRGISM